MTKNTTTIQQQAIGDWLRMELVFQLIAAAQEMESSAARLLGS